MKNNAIIQHKQNNMTVFHFQINYIFNNTFIVCESKQHNINCCILETSGPVSTEWLQLIRFINFFQCNRKVSNFSTIKYHLGFPLVISSHLSSIQNWWDILGGKTCYIDRQYVHSAFLIEYYLLRCETYVILLL